MRIILLIAFAVLCTFLKAQTVDTIKIRNSLGDIAYAMVMDTAGSHNGSYLFSRKTSGGIGLMAISNFKMLRHGKSALSNAPLKYWDTIITNPSTASGFTINISHVGFTTTPTIMSLGLRNVADATLAPQVSLKSLSSSSIVLNITQGNSSTVNLLGSLVLLGASSAFATSLSDVSVHVVAVGY